MIPRPHDLKANESMTEHLALLSDFLSHSPVVPGFEIARSYLHFTRKISVVAV